MSSEWSYTRLTGPKGDAGSGFKVEFSALPMPENGDLEVDDGTSTSFLELSDGTNLFIEAGNDSSEGKGWHYPFTDGDLYMRTWSDLDKRWSMGTRIVGEDGEPAVTYEIDEPIVFRQGDTATFRFYRVIEGKRYEARVYYAVATSDDGITYGTEIFGTGTSYTTAALNTAVSVRCRIYASLEAYTAGETYLDEEFIELVNDGISVHLGNENITLACDSSGKLKTAFSTNITVSTLMGTSRVASVITAGSQSTGITIGTITSGTVSADGIIPLSMSANGTPVEGKLIFTIAAGGATFTKEVNVAVTKDGQQGEPGNPGTPGVDGKGIQYETAYYALSTTLTKPAQSEFSTTIPTVDATNKYMWMYIVTTYTDYSTSGGYNYAYIASTYGNNGDDAITLWTDTSIVEFSKRLDGTSNYETKSIQVRLYKGSTQITTLTANDVTISWTGGKTSSGGTVTVTMNHSDGGSVQDTSYSINVSYGGKTYITRITVTNVYGGKYLGKATSVNGANVTIGSSTVTAKLGDYFTWGGATTSSYTQGLCYEYRAKYNNQLIYFWGDVNGNAEAYSTAFGDIMSLVNAPDSNNPAMIMAKNLAANQAFIGSLFSEYIKVLASIRVGDRYNESGTIIDNTKTGAWFGNSGVLKAHRAELTELDVIGGTFDNIEMDSGVINNEVELKGFSKSNQLYTKVIGGVCFADTGDSASATNNVTMALIACTQNIKRVKKVGTGKYVVFIKEDELELPSNIQHSSFCVECQVLRASDSQETRTSGSYVTHYARNKNKANVCTAQVLNTNGNASIDDLYYIYRTPVGSKYPWIENKTEEWKQPCILSEEFNIDGVTCYGIGIVTTDFNTDDYVNIMGGCKLILIASYLENN